MAARSNSFARPAGEDQPAEAYDVVVVGFGGAGACAAIEAHRKGARVLILDRFTGGGATARSGGVVYLGGGSHLQQAAGYSDNPEEMFRYLRFEVGDAVDEATLRRYCDESLDHLAFLEDLGVPFPPRGNAPKTSYPDDDVTLYFSGNELCPPYSEGARIAPRGHRVLGRALTGNVLFKYLRREVERLGIEVRTHCEAVQLVEGEGKRVVGLRVRELPLQGNLRRRHDRLTMLATGGVMLIPSLGRWAQARLEALETGLGEEHVIRARGGVILCAGGFGFNRKMLREFAPIFADSMPLGTIGDSGRGIALGRDVGGVIDRMDRCTAFRFINPPVSLTHGILVNERGQRFCNEEYYGATLGDHIGYEQGGRAYLIFDARTRRRILDELWKQRKLNFQSITALLNLFVNRKQARSVEALATACGMIRGSLSETIDGYNDVARKGLPDPLGKSRKASEHPIDSPPYYAVVCDLDNRWFPTPTFTVGGLVVSGETGALRDAEGSTIDGVYAAGRNAVGISSHSYVSGLSLGDCIFSGRRAGHAAAEAAEPRSA